MTQDQQEFQILKQSARISQASRMNAEADIVAIATDDRRSQEHHRRQQERLTEAMVDEELDTPREGDTMLDEDDTNVVSNLGDTLTEIHHHHPPPQKSNLLPLAITAVVAAIGGGGVASIPVFLDAVKPAPAVAPVEPGEDTDTKYEFRISSGDPTTKD